LSIVATRRVSLSRDGVLACVTRRASAHVASS